MTEKLDLRCWTLFARVNAQSDTKRELAKNEGQKSPNVKAHLLVITYALYTLLERSEQFIAARQRITRIIFDQGKVFMLFFLRMILH